MTITVKDTLNLDSLMDAEVVAGHKGLDNKIMYVNVMEVPDIIDWIESYEMILTTAYPFREDDQGLEQLVQELQTKKLAAFAIKPDRYITGISEKVINMGNRLNIPIIKLPSNARFDLIINEIMREIVNKDYSIIKKSEETHKKFTEVALAGGGLEEIANILSEITEQSVLIEDSKQNEIARSQNFINIEKDIKAKEEKRAIYIYERVNAYIKLISIDKEFTEENIMALERARDAAAILLLKRNAEKAIEREYKNEFLNSVLNGKFESRESIIARGEFYNIKLEDSYLLFLLSIDSFDEVFSVELEKAEIKAHNIITDIFNIVFNAFFSKTENSVIWSMNKKIYVLYPIKKEDIKDTNKIKKMSRKIAEDMKNKVDKHIQEFSITIGVGRFYEDILDISKSLKEASEALRIGKLIWGDNHIYHYNDIETYSMLIKSGSRKELEKYVKQKLGKLITYDHKNNTELVNTLENILNNNGVLKDVAADMFLHPKTVSYRRDRIESLLDVSLNKVDEKFELYMALKIKKLLYL